VVHWRVEHESLDAPACWLLDHAGAHITPAVSARLTLDTKISRLPKKMTHVWQPADQYIIKDIKGGVNHEWDAWTRTLWKDKGVAEAVKSFCTRSVPVLRARLYLFLSRAINRLKEAVILASWEMTGLLRLLYNDVPSRPVVFDLVRQRAAGLAGIAREDDLLALPPLVEDLFLPGRLEMFCDRSRPWMFF